MSTGRGALVRWGTLMSLGLLSFGATTPASAAPAAPKCLTSDDFFVVYRESHLGPGSDIVARRRGPDTPTTCTYAKEPGDFEPGARDDADYVVGLSGRMLVVDRGTGPSRKLVIYDLAARKAALTLSYDSSSPVKVEPGVVMFSAITGRATPKTCPKFNEYAKQGLGAAMTIPTRIALPSLARSTSGAARCVAQQ